MLALQDSPQLWQSHLDARAIGMMPPPPPPQTETGRELCKRALEVARAMSKSVRATPTRAPVAPLTSWTQTGYEYRRMLCVMAKLPLSTADRADRDLTETEKAMLRAAAQRVAQGVSGLAASL